MLEKVHGLVVKEVNVGDRDKIITIITRELGKISAMVRGCRVIKSKRLSACNLMCYGEFSINTKGEKRTVTESSLIESFFKIREGIEQTALAYYVCELANIVSYENIVEGEVLSLTLNTLHMLTKQSPNIKKIKCVFELRLMALVGLMPDLVSCKGCNCYDGEMVFSLKNGDITCIDCKVGSIGNKEFKLSGGVLRALRHIIYSDDKKIFAFELEEDNMELLSTITQDYIEEKISEKIKTLDFLKAVL